MSLLKSLAVSTLVFCLGPAGAFAQSAKVGIVQGFVSTQSATVRLPGAEVVVRTTAGVEVATLLSDADGHFATEPLPPGKYQIAVSLSGFDAVTQLVEVKAGKPVDVSIDLPISKVSQTVTVVGATNTVANEGTLASSDTIAGAELDQFSPGGGLQAALRLIASIIEVPGGVSIKGGRPSQSSVQLGPTSLVNPTTGLSQVALPDDAIDSVAVLPNPYAVEYGRFSSGLVVIQTRRAGDQWRMRINNIDPTFRTERGGSPVDVKGIGVFAPRIEIGGPILKDRLFIEQTGQYRYTASDVASRPEDELRTEKYFSSFTRADANLSPRHSMVMTGGFFPRLAEQDTLGTFTPPDATVNVRAHDNQIGVTERALWTNSMFSETTLVAHDYQSDVSPQGSATMTLLPDTTAGNFYNQQHRSTGAVQVISTLSGSREAVGGLHLFKVGVDIWRSHFEGSSASGPVLIDREDGTLARRLDFQPFSAQSAHGMDMALFAQDRYQPDTRWYLEFGGRVDRDGVADQFNLTPRVGTAVLLTESGSATLRGGFGLFYERTPLLAGAFNQFEAATDTRFSADGSTMIGLPLRYAHVTGDLMTPRSRTLDVAYDQRLNKMWSIHAGAMDRAGTHELIVNPIQTATAAQLVLTSTGTSQYREVEAGFNFTLNTRADLHVTYTRSKALGDLNVLSNFFDGVMWPVIGVNQYAPVNADAPNRLLMRGRIMPTRTWLFIGTFDWRSGLPYSIVNDTLDFVGDRNSQRFPAYARLEFGAEHRFKIGKFQPWIGLRAYNALDSFLPTDVQANLGSRNFGSFYNSEYRQFRLQVRFER